MAWASSRRYTPRSSDPPGTRSRWALGAWLAWWVALLLAAACAPRESPEEFLVSNAVRKYNRALIEAYRMADPALLADVAGEAEVRKVDVLIATLKMQRKALRASLDNLRIVGVERRADGQAEVKTSEDWTYEHVRQEDARERLGPPKRIHYELTYSLEHRQGQWIVTGLRHDLERGTDSGLRGMLIRPGFLGTRAPVLPDAALMGLLVLIPCGATAWWFRRTGRATVGRWMAAGGYAALLAAVTAWTLQGLMAGLPETRGGLSPILQTLGSTLAWLVPAALILAMLSGGIALYGELCGREQVPPAPLRVAAPVVWIAASMLGIAHYWLAYVA